jgi:hypothetical protein
MKSIWYKPIVLETLDVQWDTFSASPGVYIVMSDRPIQRIGGTDFRSIIYIGKAKNLRNRLWAFWKANHSASGFLWTHPTMANIVLNKPVRTVSDVEKYLGKLEILLDSAERALLFAYIQCFGEAPPLNLSLPKRWNQLPPAEDLRWAEEGLFV